MTGLLTREEIVRYQRHLSLAGFGPAGQAGLKSGSVLVIGAGGLGCPVLLYLAAAGVGRITIVDFDRVEISNLQRQVLFGDADAGQPKAEAAARRLRALNPLIAIEPRVERFSRANALALVGAHDVIVDGSDNFATRYLVNDACVLAGKPFVYGAVQGFEGQVSVFNWKSGPTYRCLFPEPPDPGMVPNCAEAGILGVLPGLVGTAQACEAIKLLTGIGEPLSGRLLLWNAMTMTMQTVAFAADPRSRDIRDLPPEGYGETCETTNVAGVADPGSRLQRGRPRDNASMFKFDFGSKSAEEIDVADLRAKMAAPEKPQLIDVREGWERALGSIEPSVHVPLGAIDGSEGAATLSKLDPKAPTVVYCAAGVRSLHGARALRERYGFESALSLRGGYHAWEKFAS
jgi:adenylyltransferase/sulfurtransferase